MIESYAKKLLDLAEWAMEKGAEGVLVLATTSEGASYRLLARHNYVAPEMLWNLDRDSASKLLSHLGAPRELHNTIYRLTGGNPCAILELASLGWNTEEWIGRIAWRIRHTVEELLETSQRELEEAVEDVDSIAGHPSLRDVLLENNLVTPVTRPCLGYTPLVDRELGIGRLYAWQIPAYREAVKKLLHEQPTSLH